MTTRPAKSREVICFALAGRKPGSLRDRRVPPAIEAKQITMNTSCVVF